MKKILTKTTNTLGTHPISMYQLPVDYDGSILSVLEAKATESRKKLKSPMTPLEFKKKEATKRNKIVKNNKLYYGL